MYLQILSIYNYLFIRNYQKVVLIRDQALDLVLKLALLKILNKRKGYIFYKNYASMY